MGLNERNIMNKYLTIIYRDLTKDEIANLCRHSKISAASWSHVMNERNEAIRQLLHVRKEKEKICAQAYQVVGSLLNDLGVVNTPEAEKILDNLSQSCVVHDDVLPWESITPPIPKGVLTAIRNANLQLVKTSDSEYTLVKLKSDTAHTTGTDESAPYRYAKSLAIHLWSTYYKDTSPNWKPCDSLMGVMSQIDNMLTGLKHSHEYKNYVIISV